MSGARAGDRLDCRAHVKLLNARRRHCRGHSETASQSPPVRSCSTPGGVIVGGTDVGCVVATVGTFPAQRPEASLSGARPELGRRIAPRSPAQRPEASLSGARACRDGCCRDRVDLLNARRRHCRGHVAMIARDAPVRSTAQRPEASLSGARSQRQAVAGRAVQSAQRPEASLSGAPGP